MCSTVRWFNSDQRLERESFYAVFIFSSYKRLERESFHKIFSSGAQTPCGSCGSTGTCEDSCSEPRRTAQGSVCQRVICMTKFLEGQKNIDEPQTQVKEASCYGNLASCETPGQKCCRTTYERVCQQVKKPMGEFVSRKEIMMK